MKRGFSLLLAVLLCIGSTVCAAESADAQAVLTFFSFEGGGYVYSFEIEDPSILSGTAEWDYGGSDPEVEDGASYAEVLTFTGLKPGTTSVAVYGRSPILENDDAVYTATVDEALHVTLTAQRVISTFFLYRSGKIDYDTYRITHEQDGYRVSVNDGEEQAIDGASMDSLMRVVEDYDLARWDGFSESKIGVPDGEDFWLEIRLMDGTHILARGTNAYPEDYFPAMDAMEEILGSAETGGLDEREESAMRLTIDGTEVPVTWEENASVAALRELLPLTIHMSMYGGFEQVGPIGRTIARDDAQTTTASGDIVLYSGNQIVIFYGSNAWAYTRLGHVDLPTDEMERLLGNGDVTIAIEEARQTGR